MVLSSYKVPTKHYEAMSYDSTKSPNQSPGMKVLLAHLHMDSPANLTAQQVTHRVCKCYPREGSHRPGLHHRR